MPSPDDSKEKKNCCVLCGKPSSTRCSQCQSTWYCGRECQKKDWKQHKKTCFPANSICTRCLEPTTANGGVCCVPHPEYLLENMGSSFGAGMRRFEFRCLACREDFSKYRQESETSYSYQPAHAEWCFQGNHTVKPLPLSDQRQVCKDIVTIKVAGTTQDVQDALTQMDAAKVRVLVIQPADGFFMEDATPILDLNMPLLEELQLIDVAFSKIVLNDDKTPRLQKIELQNVPDDCDIEIHCSALREFDARYHHGDCDWVQEMLDKATRLREFRSYKLGMYDVKFASTELEEIHVHRSDCLSDVSIWAPQLRYLRLQGCYSLEKLSFPKNHPTLPTPSKLSRFTVETTNSCLSDQVIRKLESNPRAIWDGDEVDEQAGVGGGPLEAMFRMMHQQQGF